MFSSKMLIACALVLAVSGCSTVKCKKTDTAEVLPGTSTALVGLYLDKNGYPQPTVETVIVAPGQRIVFSGPQTFDIIFKDKKSPVDKFELSSRNGILVLDIPKDVFNQEDRDDPSNKGKNEISYKYGIRVGGKITDPEIIVRPR